MEILLHVGAHRTATTTMQRMLHQSRPALQGAGWAFWGPKRLRGGLFQGLYGPECAVLPWQAGRARGRVQMQLSQAVMHGATGVVVSEENMLGTMRDALDDICLYSGAGARVARFAEAFQGHDVTLALGIRCYDAWWASALAFRLMKGGPLPRRGLCERLVTQPRRWRHLVAEIAQAVPGARLKVWTHEALGNRPNGVMHRLTGRAIGYHGADGRHNATPGPDRLREYLETCGVSPRLIREAAGRFMPFDADQRAVLRAQYAEDLAWLATGAGGLADYIDEVRAMIPGPTGQGRGRSDGRRHGQDDAGRRRLARSG